MNIASHLHTNGERHLEYQNGYSQQSKQNEKDSESSYTDVVPSDTNNKKVDDMEVSKTLRKKLPNKFIKLIVITPKLLKDIQLLHYTVVFNNLLIVLTGDVLSGPETGEPEFRPRLARAFYGYNGGVKYPTQFFVTAC